ncbi:MAG: hypothetical protein RLZZ400_933 [Actinomycetota bacterium]
MTKANRRVDDVYFVSRLALGTLAGAMSYFAYPRPNIWPLIFLSVGLMFFAVRGTTLPRAATIGLSGGFAFFAAQCWWISQYLGPVPLIALATSQALFVALSFVLFVWLDRRLNARILGAVLFAIVWTAREWVTTHFPYGGFPWSRLAMSQAYSPLADWVYFGGFSLLSFVIALSSCLTVVLLPYLFRVATTTRTVSIMMVLAIVLFGVPATAPNNTEGTPFTVAGIQGNANAGLFANTRPGEILQNHLDVTEDYLSSNLTEGVQLVVWPENASDLDPLRNDDVAIRINALVNEQLGVPLALGTLTEVGNSEFNSSLLWKPTVGLADQYDKKRPVPFAEYVPDRDFWYSLAPDLIGLIYRGYTFGTRDPIFEIDGHPLGVLICFEIAIDESLEGLVDSGAQAILLQSNNADFGHSDEAYQQLAVAKLRAIETGLPLINVSTTGPSGIFASDGKELVEVPAFQPRFFAKTINLKTSDTPAMGVGRYFDEGILVLLSLIVLLALTRRTRQ